LICDSDHEAEAYVQVIDRFVMLQVAVSNMPRVKGLYADKLGLKVTTDYRQDDDNWWVSLSLPQRGAAITLTTHHAHMKSGTITILRDLNQHFCPQGAERQGGQSQQSQ
jgi:hypothetical protein